MAEDELKVRVVRKVIEAEGIAGFHLVAVDGSPLAAFSAGAHIDVCTPAGCIRQYSLCNRPDSRSEYQIAVLDDPDSRGGSASMHREVREGDLLNISRPRNHFPLAETAGAPLLLAGGIGVTPILCMAESLSAANASFEMHYFTRSVARTAFLSRIEASAFAAQVNFHFADAPVPPGDLNAILEPREPARRVYVCGPAGFLEAVRSTACNSGWPKDRVHFEYFAAQPAPAGDRTDFEVRLARSGQVIRVGGAESVADALIRHGIDIPLSCEQGVCGTCVTRVLAGVPDHCDVFLTDEQRAANNLFTPCCSRARSASLTLDL
jgi:vanillate monooxygenase ferredoxin subunit